jgi:hypothetical protein
MSKDWLIRNRALVHWAIPAFFGLLGVITAGGVFLLEHTTDNKLLIFIIALIIPSSITLIILTELALAWFYDIWLTGSRELVVKTFSDAREFARFRRDTIRGIKPGTLDDAIYTTSHCNLFAKPEGRENIRTEVRQLNLEFFQFLAHIALEPGNRGGLRLLVHFESNERDELWTEMRERVQVFSTAAFEKDMDDWNWHHFDVRHLLQGSAKDYLVIEDHIFKTIRKTEASNGETQYVYMRSAEIAATYRRWLADLFDYGENFETEKERIREIVLEIKNDLGRSR